jgi:hypothetical protein
VKLLQNRLLQAEFTRTVWTATPEPGTTLDEMVVPEYWAHVAKSIKAGDRIEVTSSDKEWFAELFVRSVAANDVRIYVLRSVNFSEKPAPAAEAADNGLDIKHRGAAGWSVVRRSDKQVLFERGATKADAEDFVKFHALG